MTITVENSSDSLLGLLWVRGAWGLAPAGDAPPPLENSPETLTPAHDRAAWEQTWSDLWAACLLHEAQGPDPRLFNQLQSTEDGSAERAQLLAELIGPNWRTEFGVSALDGSFAEWQRVRHEEVHEANITPLDASPERRSLHALIAAWEAGLTKVITIPCVGEYTRFVSTSALLVTEITRQEPARYSIALSTFRKHADGEDR